MSPPDRDQMPITPLGVHNGLLQFRSAAGDVRQLSPADLVDKTTLIALFGGRETWLRQNFPLELVVVAERSGGGRRVPIGIDVRAAASHLADRCVDAEEARRTVPLTRGTARISRWTRAKARFLDWLGWHFNLIRAVF